ncbi:MAG: Uma2 family endonuclease [Gloeocapsa sp. UFS-A4-WI-NPMV-4B04]|jgi:Uma2 family endonuclease|nr:Uma2 family endonuclease [Gloeocapsa sp. UFS-A4-WI-NPMV-4B04]
MAMVQTPLFNQPFTAQRLVYGSITWQQFKLIQTGFAESPGVKIFYYNDEIEILIPGREHNIFSRVIGFLIELFCLENNIEFDPTGSMTQEREEEVSAEADESYCFGESKPTPDLVIEVVFTSGSSKKLQRYQALSIPELWLWQDGLFSLYHLRDNNYEQISRSEIPELATLDIDLLNRCVLIAQTSRLEAATTFRKALKPN